MDVVGRPPVLDTGRAGIDPGQVAHRTVGPNVNSSARASAHTPFDVGVGDVDRIHQAKTGSDIATGFVYVRVVFAVRAVARVT